MAGHLTARAFIASLLVAALCAGCKDNGAEHPAADRARDFLEAVQYGDFESAAAMHIDGTERGFYCASQAFDASADEARRAATDEECERLEQLGSGDFERFEPEARLLVQMVRFYCEEPDGDCRDYGRRVLESHLRAVEHSEGPTPWSFEEFELKKVVGDDDEAVAYLDLHGGADAQRPTHETLTLRRVDGQWVVDDSPDDHTDPVR